MLNTLWLGFFITAAISALAQWLLGGQAQVFATMVESLFAMAKLSVEVMVLLFGTLTLVLQDDRFIKWKPTVLYGAMALALAIAVWGMKKNILQMLLGSQLTLPDGVWMRLNQAWIAYCAFMSAVNAYVVMNFSTEFWVDFKLWGYAFPLVFLVGQGLYIAPHIKGDEPAR